MIIAFSVQPRMWKSSVMWDFMGFHSFKEWGSYLYPFPCPSVLPGMLLWWLELWQPQMVRQEDGSLGPWWHLELPSQCLTVYHGAASVYASEVNFYLGVSVMCKLTPIYVLFTYSGKAHISLRWENSLLNTQHPSCGGLFWESVQNMQRVSTSV